QVAQDQVPRREPVEAAGDSEQAERYTTAALDGGTVALDGQRLAGDDRQPGRAGPAVVRLSQRIAAARQVDRGRFRAGHAQLRLAGHEDREGPAQIDGGLLEEVGAAAGDGGGVGVAAVVQVVDQVGSGGATGDTAAGEDAVGQGDGGGDRLAIGRVAVGQVV